MLHEVVWNNGPGSASGGGVSAFFPVPRWQQNAGVPPSANPGHQTGRGVPDVGGIADPQTGVVIITLDGQSLAVVGGTSATAPMRAALVSRLNQALQTRLGFIDPALYGPMAPYVTRDIILGNNGAYAAGIGWDACTGVGSPRGTALLYGFGLLQASRAHPQPPPPAPPSDAPTPFEAALRSLVELQREAWTNAAAATAQGTAPETARAQFGERVSSAFGQYLAAVQAGWKELDASAVTPVQLRAIGDSLTLSAWQASWFTPVSRL